MTVAVVQHLPGKGAVFACDSRLTMNTTIMSDECDKWLLCGTTTLVIVGEDGGLSLALAGCKNIQQVLRTADEYSTPRDVDWIALGYDQESDRIFALTGSGTLQPLTGSSAIGCGSAYAKGVFDCYHKPKDLRAAARLSVSACNAAIKHDACCGGDVRVITHRTSGKVTVK